MTTRTAPPLARLLTPLALLALLTLAGCGLAQPYPAINTFDLEPQTLPPPPFTQVRPKVILVNQLGSAAAYETRKLIYKTKGGRLMEDFYNELVAPPGRLLADSLAAWLDRVCPDAQVVRARGLKGADYVLEGYLAELLGDFSQNPPVARITVVITLNDIRRGQVQIVLARTYQAQAQLSPGLDRPAPELIQALTEAWGQIRLSVSQDLNDYFRATQKKNAKTS
ncbi:MAG: ABC-type transport auxiliary lipoprotein family protein [Deltaproteobacteria bacterium]|jgi:ABC-type uncharacterized transport system auxiliary subunit|nr:ABC-type transport auxiliary lipoprotein family protein [Deltaproteobacteria bacterium]